MCGHKYTNEEKSFMSEYVPGHSYAEIQKAFANKFGWEITTRQIKNYIGNHHLNTGRNGRFERGMIPSNKGQKMSKEQYEKCKATMFKKGNVPKNHKYIGSERITKDGFVEIKIEEPNRWRLKHRYMYEQYHNIRLNKNQIVIMIEKNNFDKDNLLLVDRSVLKVMNQNLNNIDIEIPEIKLAIINLAKNIDAMNKAKKRK